MGKCALYFIKSYSKFQEKYEAFAFWLKLYKTVFETELAGQIDEKSA